MDIIYFKKKVWLLKLQLFLFNFGIFFLLFLTANLTDLDGKKVFRTKCFKQEDFLPFPIVREYITIGNIYREFSAINLLFK